MRQYLTALILLFAFACGLLAGPHPCHARRAAPSTGSEASKEGNPACHSQPLASHRAAGPSLSSRSGEDCCSRQHGSLCESICQTVGVVGGQVLPLVIQPLARMTALAVDRSLPSFAHAIDHVPLA